MIFLSQTFLLLETFFNRKNLNVLIDRRARVERSSNELRRCIRMLRFAWKPRYCNRLLIPGKDLPSAAWCKRTSNFTSTGSRRKVDTIINLRSNSSANIFFCCIKESVCETIRLWIDDVLAYSQFMDATRCSVTETSRLVAFTNLINKASQLVSISDSKVSLPHKYMWICKY